MPLNAWMRSGQVGAPGTLLTLLLVGLTLSGCGGSDGSPSSQSPVGSNPVAPAITTQPASQTVSAGQTATFTVTATGTAPLSYQWQKNGTAIGGATAASYTTPATTASDNGDQFTVVVSNAAGSVTSNAAALTVTSAPVAPTITRQPASQTVSAGQRATFTVTATGTAPLSYQWQRNGTAIGGATAVSYTTPATTASDTRACPTTCGWKPGPISAYRPMTPRRRVIRAPRCIW